MLTPDCAHHNGAGNPQQQGRCLTTQGGCPKTTGRMPHNNSEGNPQQQDMWSSTTQLDDSQQHNGWPITTWVVASQQSDPQEQVE